MWLLWAFAFIAVFGGLGLVIGLGWFAVPVALLFGPPLLYVFWWLLWLMQERDNDEKPVR